MATMKLTKSQSIRFMQSLGFNTLDCTITQDLVAVENELKDSSVLYSMRTERGNEFACPFYFCKPAAEIINFARQHLDEGYTLLIYPALPTVDCLAFGAIGLPASGELVIEVVEEAGLVRELDNHTKKKTIIIKPGELRHVFAKNHSLKFPWAIEEVLSEVIYLLWDYPKPCVVEWSYYKRLVGALKKNAIYWEIRDY